MTSYDIICIDIEIEKWPICLLICLFFSFLLRSVILFAIMFSNLFAVLFANTIRMLSLNSDLVIGQEAHTVPVTFFFRPLYLLREASNKGRCSARIGSNSFRVVSQRPKILRVSLFIFAKDLATSFTRSYFKHAHTITVLSRTLPI